MNNRKRPRRWAAEHSLAAFAAFAALGALPATAAPQQSAIECGPAQDMAAHAYTELRNAILQHDYSGACRLRNVFWQIEKYGSACPNVSKMAALLSEKSLGRNDICPASSGIVTGIGAQGGTSGSTSAGSATMSGSNGGGSITSSSGSSGSSGNTGSSSSGSSSTGTGTGTDASGSGVGR